MPRPRSTSLLVAALALAAGACAGGDDAVTVAEAPPEETSVTRPTTVAPEATSAGVDPEVDQAPPTTAPARIDGCLAVEESPDGRYAVSEAGHVVVVVEGDLLRLVEVRPAEGWAIRKAKDDGDEVEVELRADRKVTFEAELDDDGLELEVCDKD
jgi:hypothetical protein